ncbi:MAG TPA: AI-2E family transporter [Candidatus Limnocylindrales bacterium]|nr:AI-2E family transporter [Candidatus Limnocylindrales bacterium]
MRSEVLRWSARGVGLAVGVALVVGTLAVAGAAARVLFLVFIAVLLASGLEPLIGWLRTKLRLPRGATILVVYLAFLVAVVALALVVVPAALAQADEVLRGLPPLLENLRARTAELRPAALATSLTALVDAARASIRPAPPQPEEVLSASFAVAETAAALATLLAVVYFWLVEHARLQRYVLAFLPAWRRPGARDAWNEIENRLGRWVRGQLLLMTIVGTATGTVYFLIGVPSAILLGLVAGLAEAIPLVGPVIGAIPALVVAAMVSPQLAILVALVYIVVHLVEGNVLVPVVMRNTIGLSPFMVIVSLLLGGAVAGVVGAFVAVPLAAAVEVILERVQARETAVAPDPALRADAEEEDASRAALPDSRGGANAT